MYNNETMKRDKYNEFDWKFLTYLVYMISEKFQLYSHVNGKI